MLKRGVSVPRYILGTPFTTAKHSILLEARLFDILKLFRRSVPRNVSRSYCVLIHMTAEYLRASDLLGAQYYLTSVNSMDKDSMGRGLYLIAPFNAGMNAANG